MPDNAAEVPRHALFHFVDDDSVEIGLTEDISAAYRPFSPSDVEQWDPHLEVFVTWKTNTYAAKVIQFAGKKIIIFLTRPIFMLYL